MSDIDKLEELMPDYAVRIERDSVKPEQLKELQTNIDGFLQERISRVMSISHPKDSGEGAQVTVLNFIANPEVAQELADAFPEQKIIHSKSDTRVEPAPKETGLVEKLGLSQKSSHQPPPSAPQRSR